MKKVIPLVFSVLVFSGVYSQNINHYKYIVIPKKFSVLKDTNQYQLNTLTKFLFRESGFTTVYDDALPEELQNNNCLGLKAELLASSGLFNTKLAMQLRDCKNKVVFTSAEGKSRKKDYKQAHHEALRNAFRSITAINYKYTPPPAAVVKPATVVKNTTQSRPAEKTGVQNTPEPATPPPASKAEKVLYAQPITNGFQLVDNSPKVVYSIQKTSLEDLYIIKDKNGILYKKDTGWIAEYYNDTKLVKEILTVKF